MAATTSCSKSAAELLRVQCKWAALEGDVIRIQLATSRSTPRGYVREPYSATEIDAVAAYCHDLDECYFLPASLIAGKFSLQLRRGPTRNGQRAALNWAADYGLSGAIAQLGERRRGTAEAVGSSPTSSTSGSTDGTPITIGAHEFRERFGYWMEVGASGQEIVVTRRGRPSVHLAPMQPRLVAGDTTRLTEVRPPNPVFRHPARGPRPGLPPRRGRRLRRRAPARAPGVRLRWGLAAARSSSRPHVSSTRSVMTSWNIASSESAASGRRRSSASRTSGQRSSGRPASSNGFHTSSRKRSTNARADALGVAAQPRRHLEPPLGRDAERRQLVGGARQPRAALLVAPVAEIADQAQLAAPAPGARAAPRRRTGRRAPTGPGSRAPRPRTARGRPG